MPKSHDFRFFSPKNVGMIFYTLYCSATIVFCKSMKTKGDSDVMLWRSGSIFFKKLKHSHKNRPSAYIC